MARLVHRDVRQQILQAAGIDPTEAATIFPLARAVAAYVRDQGLAGVDTTDAGELAALKLAVAEADTAKIVKAVSVAREAGLLVTGL